MWWGKMPIFVLHAEKLFTSFSVLEKSVSPTFFFLLGLASKGLSWEKVQFSSVQFSC